MREISESLYPKGATINEMLTKRPPVKDPKVRAEQTTSNL